jgi:hypothetical protein
MSASSSGAPDDGIPVAIPDHYYPTVIDSIQRYGRCRVNITGQVKLVAENHSHLYSSFGSVPQIYVEAEEVTAIHTERASNEVSVAVSFKSTFEGLPGLYATYVTFDPAVAGSRKEAIEWLNNEYVQARYGGTIVTDFDQQANSFSRVLFSLDTVMTKHDLSETIRSLASDDVLRPFANLQNSKIVVIDKFYGEVVMGDKAGRDVIGGDKVGGDKVFGDKTGGDKVGHDKVTGSTAADTRAATRPFLLISVMITVASVLFAAFGLWLAVQDGGTAGSSINLFGQDITTQSIGVACIFIGAVVFVVTLSRTLKILRGVLPLV